jgi:hypothetical protein
MVESVRKADNYFYIARQHVNISQWKTGSRAYPGLQVVSRAPDTSWLQLQVTRKGQFWWDGGWGGCVWSEA